MLVVPVDRTGPSQARTYSAASDNVTIAATPTDVFIINGAASVIVKVYRLWFSGVLTTAGVFRLVAIKRSAANSGGTAVALTNVPNDSSDAAATAVAQHYTANPTINGTVGNVWAGRVNISAPATAGIGGFAGAMIDFVAAYGKPVTLRGTAQGLALNLAGQTTTGLVASMGVTWTEENV